MTVELQVGIDGQAKRIELQFDRQSASGNIDGDDVGSLPELSRGAEKNHL